MPVGSNIPNLLEVGWGRAAVSRFTKTPEEIRAEVIKALEGKISVEFKDYSQWEREPVLPVKPLQQTTKHSTRLPKKQPPTRPLTGVSGTSCSTLCVHPWTKKPPVVDQTAANKTRDNVAILELLVEAKQKSVSQYGLLCNDLKTQNKVLKEEISKVSSKAYQAVTELLEKYENYAGASITMKRNHAKEQLRNKEYLRTTSNQLNSELQILEQEVVELDEQLSDFQQDLQILRTYKDKEYPVKAMQISRLAKNLEELASKQKLERGEIERVTSGEALKLQVQCETRMKNIMSKAAEKIFAATVSAGTQHMAWHNTILQREIEEHKQDILKQEVAIRHLNLEIDSLQQMPESNMRLSVFPEVFFPSTKCHPDEDVVLDIPTQQPLPI